MEDIQILIQCLLHPYVFIPVVILIIIYLKRKKEYEESSYYHVTDAFVCPQCKGQLVLRTAKRGAYAGNQFYGCSNYPNCRYIQNITKKTQ